MTWGRGSLDGGYVSNIYLSAFTEKLFDKFMAPLHISLPESQKHVQEIPKITVIAYTLSGGVLT